MKTRLPLLVLVGAAVGVALSCGAEDLEAPPAEQQADLRQCRGMDALMPNFLAAIDQGRTANLKHVIEAHLLTPLREGDSPPASDVLRSVFNTLDAFARKPPERGAPEGQLCAPADAPPPLTEANELCELRRSMDVLVHQGKGIEALELLGPQLNIALDYFTGEGLTCDGRPRTPHYEVAAIVSGLCAQDANCQLSNGLDLVIAFSAYARTPDGKALMEHLNGLSAGTGFSGLLDPSKLTEEDAVAIVKALLPAIQGADAAGLENAFSQLPLSAEVKADLRPVIDDLKKLLAREDLMTPVHRALNCFTSKDKNNDLVRMVYRLAIAEKCPEFGLTRLTEAVKGLQSVDERGSLLYLAGTLATAVRRDETAVDSAALVCKTLFSTAREPGEARSNAELALPVVADLVKHHIVDEAICAADTLIFGCAGGSQPACR